ncbi:MAG: TniB family NTP-binding protein [Clostridiales bacterium]|nr:TniB family NTP-binding protein [Clostridiales bacterium]
MLDKRNILFSLPKMKTGKELVSAMEVLPAYEESIRNECQANRLIALADLYQIYIPSQMSLEIYSKLYLALLRSLQKKQSKVVVQQYYENHKATLCMEYSGVMGGADSFTIFGASGIGKSSAITRAIQIITENPVIEAEKPYTRIIPCVVVQCPFDCSVKGLLLEILRKVDEVLQSSYYTSATKSRNTTTDTLIGLISSIAINHIGLLVIDEIQNVAVSKNGKNLVGMLMQLINNSGISICMVGTPECTVFFESAMQLARRSLGLHYGAMEYGAEFIGICKVLYSYQYVQQQTEITDAVIEWLFEHSSGIVSIVVSLIHDAQEIAILNGTEILDLEALNEAYQKRLEMLHGYIQPTIKQKQRTTIRQSWNAAYNREPATDIEVGVKIADLAAMAKSNGENMVDLLKEYFSIEEVTV